MSESKNPVVTLETTKGNITIELYPEKAPETVANFIQYVQDGFYDGTIFHRVIPNFMVQGGGFTDDMSEKSTREPIKNEANNGLANENGTIAMARTPNPHSASSQFFINVKDNAFLDFQNETPNGWGYCVFGKVTGGMDVVNSIVAVPTGNHGMHQDVPVEPIIIMKASVAE
ncbi:MAG: peptidylprolyl isomerase [Gammaproteobacteria bacterium]|nr:peptidylprolyl isomerase [Gammaproteobacteria bacterium]